MLHRAAPLLALLALSAAAQNLSDAQISRVRTRLNEGAKKSWETGTEMQALLELDTPSFSVLTPNTTLPPSQTAPSSLASVIASARQIVQAKDANSAQLVPDGSAADPASNGVGVLIANWTRAGGADYAGAARAQLNHLLSGVPRSSSGAISHREDYVQVWSDFVYMVPPFLAYYGVLTGNKTVLDEAYNQIKAYRSLLMDSKMGGLWKHVLLGPSANDPGYWSTGNGWAAAGMLRVLGTIKHSNYSSSMQSQQSDLVSWVKEIHNGMYTRLPSSNIFTNYVDSASTFADASSTALLASTVYRLALLASVHDHIAQADASRTALFASASNGSYTHFDADGWLQPVVNPSTYGEAGEKSAEGQAFVLMLHAAYRDYVEAGEAGQETVSAAVLTAPRGVWAMAAAGVVAGMMMVM